MAQKSGKHEGHFLAKLNAGKIFANILDAQFKSISRRQEFKRRIAHALGLFPREDWLKLQEDIDRLQGELERAAREEGGE